MPNWTKEQQLAIDKEGKNIIVAPGRTGAKWVQELADKYNANISNKIVGTYPFYIGSRAGTSLFTKMQLSSLRIYNKALSSAEIQQNYEVDKTRFNIE